MQVTVEMLEHREVYFLCPDCHSRVKTCSSCGKELKSGEKVDCWPHHGYERQMHSHLKCKEKESD